MAAHRTKWEWRESECNGSTTRERICTVCGEEAYERFSLGITAGHHCDVGWENSGYRKEGPEGFSEADAGESYEDDY